jgi:hypothetical protein
VWKCGKASGRHRLVPPRDIRRNGTNHGSCGGGKSVVSLQSLIFIAAYNEPENVEEVKTHTRDLLTQVTVVARKPAIPLNVELVLHERHPLTHAEAL